jgi:hypothetical protein
MGRIILLSTLPKLVLGSTQPPIQQVMRVFSEGKWPGHEADHTPPISAKVKNTRIHIHSPIYLHDVVLNFIFFTLDTASF